MEYVIQMLESKLNNELREREIAIQMLERKSHVMGEQTRKAFDESCRIADERIPQFVNALNLLKKT